MGLFDFITGGSDGQLKRHTKRAKNLNAQAEDREARQARREQRDTGDSDDDEVEHVPAVGPELIQVLQQHYKQAPNSVVIWFWA